MTKAKVKPLKRLKFIWEISSQYHGENEKYNLTYNWEQEHEANTFKAAAKEAGETYGTCYFGWPDDIPMNTECPDPWDFDAQGDFIGIQKWSRGKWVGLSDTDGIKECFDRHAEIAGDDLGM